MLNRRSLIALALTPFLAVSAFAQTLPDRITIATEGAYPPWNYTAPDNSLIGYEIDLIKILCERMKIKCDVISQEWNGIIPGLTVGKYDAIIASMGVTEERKKVVAFSKPYARAPNGFLTSGDNDLKDLPDAGKGFDLSTNPEDAATGLAAIKTKLEGKVIGIQTGSTAAPFAAEYLKGLDVREYPTFEQLGLELTAGRIDIAIANVTAFKAIIDANPPGTLVFTGPTFAGGLLGLGTTNVALRQADASLKTAFDKAIDEVNKDGTNATLTQKWFGTDISIKE
ncbi:transporter substrate-binding domain-containing protein [Agrobacterium sp. fls2-241-TYG-188a]|uniref:transporter substrate-binding domain-containing protein n=1 Tax=Agrobacterium sp. fls2-241-TYG-188a TaxID=3040275 RepID=UPI00254A865C|nr:transporter substrate-binding domain-containing protein [Agrobacterium sp. fls2-241-TYG-188a]